jgi:hypothetical protein
MVAGQERQRPQGAPILKFNNDSTWTVHDEPMPATREFVVVDVSRNVVRWPPDISGGGPLEVITLRANEPFPDVEQMNADTPKTEWRTDPAGNLRGPWQAQHVVHLLDPENMDRLNYPTSTIGGSVAVRELVDRVRWMRKFRAESVYPIVRLADKFMNTRFGGRQRPHFEIVRFVAFGGPEGGGAALIDKPAEPKTVAPPSAAEAVNDSIPY